MDDVTIPRSKPQQVNITVRPEVARFAEAMERKLAANDHKPHWRRYSTVHLLTRLFDEFLELQEAVDDGVPERIRDEAVDVAAFAMMIWDM